MQEHIKEVRISLYAYCSDNYLETSTISSQSFTRGVCVCLCVHVHVSIYMCCVNMCLQNHAVLLTFAHVYPAGFLISYMP